MAGFTLCGKALEQPEGSPVLRAEFHRRQVLPGRFRETALALLFLLRAMPIGQSVEFDPFVDRLIAKAGWTRVSEVGPSWQLSRSRVLDGCCSKLCGSAKRRALTATQSSGYRRCYSSLLLSVSRYSANADSSAFRVFHVVASWDTSLSSWDEFKFAA